MLIDNLAHIMNTADQSHPPPTITGAFFTLFQAIYFLFTDLLGAVFQLVTPWNGFILVIIAFCMYLIKLFWDFLCNERNVRLTKSYVSAVCAGREMCRACREMRWLSICGNTLFSMVMLLIFLINGLMCICWIAYCFFGSLVCPLETYTEEQVAVLLPTLSPPTVSAPVSVVTGFKDAMARIRGTPSASVNGARVQRRMRGAASSGNVMHMLRRPPSEIVEEEEHGDDMNASFEKADIDPLFERCWKTYLRLKTSGGSVASAAPLKNRKPLRRQTAGTGASPTTGKRRTDSNGEGDAVTVDKRLKGKNSYGGSRGSSDEIMHEEETEMDTRGSDGEAMDDGDAVSGGEGDEAKMSD